jgi:peptidoglycan hydrolase CwlO-like protein
MAYQNPLNKWLDDRVRYWDANYERFKTTFEILLAVSLVFFPLFLSLLQSGATTMTSDQISTSWQFWGVIISFWVAVFCAIYLIRNSRKTDQTKMGNIETRLGGIETKVENVERQIANLVKSQTELTYTINNLVIEIRKERNERNDRDNRTSNM